MKYFLTVCFVWGFAAFASAQTALPPLGGTPPPMARGNAPPPPVFNPNVPFGQPQPLQPLQPLTPPSVPIAGDPDAATLPLPRDEEELEFFQGYQLGDLPPDPGPGDGPPPDLVEIIEREKERVILPLYRFKYASQYLPKTIYKKHYAPWNRHLPLARYEKDYDFAIMTAAAMDDLNAVKALLDHKYSARDLDVRNRFGDTLLMTAARYGATRVTRFLLARRADPYAGNHRGETPLRIAYMRKDPMTIGAYHSVDVRGFAPLGFNVARTPSSMHRRVLTRRIGYQARGRQFTPATWHRQ